MQSRYGSHDHAHLSRLDASLLVLRQLQGRPLLRNSPILKQCHVRQAEPGINFCHRPHHDDHMATTDYVLHAAVTADSGVIPSQIDSFLLETLTSNGAGACGICAGSRNPFRPAEPLPSVYIKNIIAKPQVQYEESQEYCNGGRACLQKGMPKGGTQALTRRDSHLAVGQNHSWLWLDVSIIMLLVATPPVFALLHEQILVCSYQPEQPIVCIGCLVRVPASQKAGRQLTRRHRSSPDCNMYVRQVWCATDAYSETGS